MFILSFFTRTVSLTICWVGPPAHLPKIHPSHHLHHHFRSPSLSNRSCVLPSLISPKFQNFPSPAPLNPIRSSNPFSLVPDRAAASSGAAQSRRKSLVREVLVAAMAEQFADSANNVVIEEVSKGLNPGMIVLLVVATFLLLFFVGNYALYVYAQKTLPPRKKKPVSKKKMKREKLKQGVSAPGE
uniref:DNA-binding protein S1FA2 n=1 Tax=Oryza brachyantha TaxID=4533 RepID=J3LXK2_ORYBR